MEDICDQEVFMDGLVFPAASLLSSFPPFRLCVY